MAITQTRTTAARRKMVSNVTEFPWATSAQARKLGIVVDNGKYYLGDLRLTPANFGVIMTQLKALGKVIGVNRRAVH